MLSRLTAETVDKVLREGHVAAGQQTEFVDEWAAAEIEDSYEYVIDNGELFSLRPPYMEAQAHPRLLLPSSQREKIVKEAHSEMGIGLFLRC